MSGAVARGQSARAVRGAVNHAAGKAAESQVERHYSRAGYEIAHRRWRGRGGEIDLVLRDGAGLVFVEVKRARDFARAAESLSQRQIRRLVTAASEFMGGEPHGTRTPARFDVALVDGQGRLDVIENAIWA